MSTLQVCQKSTTVFVSVFSVWSHAPGLKTSEQGLSFAKIHVMVGSKHQKHHDRKYFFSVSSPPKAILLEFSQSVDSGMTGQLSIVAVWCADADEHRDQTGGVPDPG